VVNAPAGKRGTSVIELGEVIGELQQAMDAGEGQPLRFELG
jgi:hypothetical protein